MVGKTAERDEFPNREIYLLARENDTSNVCSAIYYTVKNVTSCNYMR